MSLLNALRIRLYRADVGSLLALGDGRVVFCFDEAYARDATRPVLSQLYVADSESQTAAQLLDPALEPNHGNGRGCLPPFFENLLPEGQFRRHLATRVGIAPDDSFSLLAYCGLDLPGAVSAHAETLNERQIARLAVQELDRLEARSLQLPAPEGESLSGAQPKVALVSVPGGRYALRSEAAAGAHFIGKLPAAGHERLPEVEYASLTLAAAAGVVTCQYELLPLSAIVGQLPYALRTDAKSFLLVHRFDRDADTPTGRLHMEDFAQATGAPPDEKHSGTYAALGAMLLERSAQGRGDVFELVRRIKVNELLGNFDAHLKDFSLLYRTSREASLSPAYDIVAHAAYLQGGGHALPFTPEQAGSQLLTPTMVRTLANLWSISEPMLAAVIADTVDRAMRAWPALLPTLPLTDEQRTRLAAFIEADPSVAAWRRRHPKAAALTR